MVALAPDGPVVSLAFDSFNGGFGVPGAWLASDSVPPGAAAEGSTKHKNGWAWAVVGDHFLSFWTSREASEEEVWAVHDLASGELRMSTLCAGEHSSKEKVLSRSSLSPNGRYAVAGSLAFDFERNRAHCFGENEDRKGIRLLSVDDHGTAYGLTQESGSSEGTPVTVSLKTGKAEALPQDADVPFLSLRKTGGFFPRANGGALLFVSHLRR